MVGAKIVCLMEMVLSKVWWVQQLVGIMEYGPSEVFWVLDMVISMEKLLCDSCRSWRCGGENWVTDDRGCYRGINDVMR